MLNLNNVQKTGLFVLIVLLSAVVMANYPFSGYTTGYMAKNQNRYLCPKLEALEAEEKALGRPLTIDESLKRLEYCYEEKYEALPFSSWHSNAALVPWFSSTLNTLVTFSLITSIGIIFIYLFRTEKKQSNEQKP